MRVLVLVHVRGQPREFGHGGALTICSSRIVVVLENKVYVYNFADLALLHQIETCANPKGSKWHCAASLNVVLCVLVRVRVRVCVSAYVHMFVHFAQVARGVGVSCVFSTLLLLVPCVHSCFGNQGFVRFLLPTTQYSQCLAPDLAQSTSNCMT